MRSLIWSKQVLACWKGYRRIMWNLSRKRKRRANEGKRPLSILCNTLYALSFGEFLSFVLSKITVNNSVRSTIYGLLPDSRISSSCTSYNWSIAFRTFNCPGAFIDRVKSLRLADRSVAHLDNKDHRRCSLCSVATFRLGFSDLSIWRTLSSFKKTRYESGKPLLHSKMH